VKRLKGDSKAFFWTHSLQCDADGAPNAYNPQNTGIDYLANAGKPGNWWGIATDSGSSGKPYIQGSYPSGSYAPYAGYYVSTTSLEDSSYPAYDVRRYADAVNLTFVVLPHTSSMSATGVKLGDFVYVHSAITQKSAFAVYADVGPAADLGEASVALHLALGHDPYSHTTSHPRVVSGIDSGVLVLVFPGSGGGKLPTQAEVDVAGTRALKEWGGMSRVSECLLQ
jgi:hypothetical protein